MTPKDIEEIIAELEDYFGTAMMNGFPAAVIDLENLKNLGEDELKELAEKLGLD